MPEYKIRSGRDIDYIVNRLLSPCMGAVEAHGRLVQVRQHEAAERLMKAMQDFTDECRAIRRDIGA